MGRTGRGTLPTVTGAGAWTVETPVLDELTMSVHSPLVSVVAVSKVPVPVSEPTPSVEADTVTPLAGTKVPVPVSFSTVTVKVWWSPARSVAVKRISSR